VSVHAPMPAGVHKHEHADGRGGVHEHVHAHDGEAAHSGHDHSMAAPRVNADPHPLSWRGRQQ
jgi:hypothetical protein